MKRGRVVGKQTYQSGEFIGQALTEEERIFKKKFIDTKAVQFPEVNPVEMKVKSKGREIKLATYRYPSTL